jgi:ribose-phosphate pyrophosphokinase
MGTTLNLVYPEKSDIKFTVSKFPDGQQSLTITTSDAWFRSPKNDVKIMSRLNSFSDLELILCATAALRNLESIENIHLYVPYFLGARSDRKFTDGGVNYLKDVICPIINSQNYKSVTVMDPHSDVLEACLNNYKKIDNISLVKQALTKIDNTNEAREKVHLVSPDAGALKKVFHVAEHFEIDKLIIASKHRDIKTGRITHTEVPGLPKLEMVNTKYGGSHFPPPTGEKYVIIDDICDGGRTFIELAKVILKERPKSYCGTEVYLIVTHGIFSAGFETLNQYFDKIYTTNSVKEIENELVEQINVFNN